MTNNGSNDLARSIVLTSQARRAFEQADQSRNAAMAKVLRAHARRLAARARQTRGQL